MTFMDPDVFGRSLDLSCGLGLLEEEDNSVETPSFAPPPRKD